MARERRPRRVAVLLPRPSSRKVRAPAENELNRPRQAPRRWGESHPYPDPTPVPARFDESVKALETGPRDHRRGRNHDGPVHLAAEVLEAAVLDRGQRAERLLVEVIPIDLVLQQLPSEFGRAAVGLVVAHPNAVG